ncbi:MAG TPA: HesA/MoeB/ThiF family protein [Gemmatimonadaceae bacterium]|nr:HesA/MoeB/ThiF family protein [Gemmatimonadaceae bacterium]
MLSQAELERYDRQLLLPELGVAGQERLRRARVLIVGAGGLGSPAALYLAAAGVGTLGIVDSDRVEPSNLHRQILHGTPDVGSEKAASAAAALTRLNPAISIVPHSTRLTAANARSIIDGFDLVIDGSDNFGTRYAVNDSCAALGIPWVYGSVERFAGQVSVFGLGDGPCYRCVFPEAPAPGTTPSCEEIGVLGAVPGIVGAWQAAEALKILTDAGEPLSGRMMQIDVLRGVASTVRFDRRADCATCGNRKPAKVRMSESREELPPYNIDPVEVPARLREPGVRLLDIREMREVERASIAGATVVPMSRLEEEAGTLDKSEELIVFCHHGSRSRTVTDWLRAQGYRARNMTGGIDRWSREVDTAVPRY